MTVSQKLWKFIVSKLLLISVLTPLVGCSITSSIATPQTEVITSEKHVHTLGEFHEPVASTCITKGHVGYYQCSECLQYLDENFEEVDTIELDYADHEYMFHTHKESTCTQKGMTEHYTCEVCNKYFDTSKNEITKEALEIEMKKHNYIVVSKTKATPFKEGEIHYRCANCGDIVVKRILKSPTVSIDSLRSTLTWNAIPNAEKYIVYQDGKKIDNGVFTTYGIEAGANSATYAVSAYTSNTEYEGGGKSNTINLSYDYNLVDNSSLAVFTLNNTWTKGFGNFRVTGEVSVIYDESLCAKLKPNNKEKKTATITKACDFSALKEAGDYILSLKVKKSYTADGVLKFGIYDGLSWVIFNKEIDISSASSNNWVVVDVPFTLSNNLTSYFNLDITYMCDYYCLDNYLLIDDIIVKSADGSKSDSYHNDFEDFKENVFSSGYALNMSADSGKKGLYRLSVLASSTATNHKLMLSFTGNTVPTTKTFSSESITRKIR